MSDGTEIAHRQEGGGLTSAPASNSAQILAMIIDASRDPTVEGDKVKTLADLAMLLQDREQVSQFNRDRAAAIAEMPIITKDGRIIIPPKDGVGQGREQGRFAKLEDIDRVVKPIAMRHNIVYYWDVGEQDGVPKVFIELSHKNGYVWRSSGMKMPLDTSGSKNNTQGAGSSTTYGKRYTLCAAFNIQTEGDDTDGRVPNEPTHLPAERGNVVLIEATAAHVAGDYERWFGTQSPKDRAWLVSHGHHARFGGQVAIPDHRPDAARAAPPAEEQGGAPGETTPDSWIAAYEARLGAAKNMDELSRIVQRGANGMTRLKEGHADLHKRGVEAESTAYARLTATGDDGATD